MNDSIKMQCPACEKEHKVTIADIGKKVKCDCGCTWIWVIEMDEFYDPEAGT